VLLLRQQQQVTQDSDKDSVSCLVEGQQQLAGSQVNDVFNNNQVVHCCQPSHCPLPYQNHQIDTHDRKHARRDLSLPSEGTQPPHSQLAHPPAPK
jgi:hypothetical protein